jgi:hypothetical protein
MTHTDTTFSVKREKKEPNVTRCFAVLSPHLRNIVLAQFNEIMNILFRIKNIKKNLIFLYDKFD